MFCILIKSTILLLFLINGHRRIWDVVCALKEGNVITSIFSDEEAEKDGLSCVSKAMK